MDSNAFEVVFLPVCRGVLLGIAGGTVALFLLRFLDTLARHLGERTGRRRTSRAADLPAQRRQGHQDTTPGYNTFRSIR
jgi:hypothetical protein